MHPLAPLVLAWSTFVAGQTLAEQADPDVVAAEKTLRAAGVATDEPGLLRFFRDRTPSKERVEHFKTLIRDLNAFSYARREWAAAALVKAGQSAKALLLTAVGSPAKEVARRAELCLRKLELSPEPDRIAAAARVIAARKPAGAARVLLDYLPFAADEPVVEGIRAALAAVAVRDGKPADALVDALDDPVPVKRAAAAEALTRANAPVEANQLVAALKEPDPNLRYRVALALLEARRREAVPVLIDLVRDLPAHEAWRAEEALRRLAGEDAPDLIADAATPTAKVRDAWAAWWEKHGPSVDLAQVEVSQRLRGYTLLSQMNETGTRGRVYELGPDRQIKWTIGGLRYPVDAEIAGPNRVLVAEHLGRKVSERDFTGKVIWEIDVPDLPVACQPLPGGQTFIATRRRVFVLDREHKEVFTYRRGATSIATARRLPDGQIVVISGETCLRLNSDGKPVKTFPVGQIQAMGSGIDVLPDGRVIVPEFSRNRVVEYDRNGKILWSVRASRPTAAVRLPNGNTLVVCSPRKRAVEFNRAGLQVWSHTTDGRLWRVRKR